MVTINYKNETKNVNKEMKMSKNSAMYESITNQIIEMLDKGTIPWRKPWASVEEMPKNLVSKKAYRGINIWLLGFKGYSNPYWVTFAQCKKLGGQVRKGERSTSIYFWQFAKVAVKDENGKPKKNAKGEKIFTTFPMLKTYKVFNVEQCDKLKTPIVEPTKISDNEKLEKCEEILKNYKGCPRIVEAGSRACYSPTNDTINVPKIIDFHSSEEYYSTLFHEMVHSTGHKSRLAREGVTNFDSFGSHKYALEELVAEFGASFLCTSVSIEQSTLENSASYIASWKTKLKSDPSLIMKSAGQAQKATDHILGITFENTEK